MATAFTLGELVTETRLNALFSSINDAGTIWGGAVAGTTVAGSTGSFTDSVAVQSAADNTGLFLNATLTNRPAFSFGNTTTGLLALIHATNDLGLVFFTNGSAQTVAKFHASGGVSIGGTTPPPDGCLAVEGGALYLPDSSASDGVSIFCTFTGNQNAVFLADCAVGAGAFSGCIVSIGRNTSGGGAAGILQITGKGGGVNYLWPDNSGTPGLLRISTAPPEEDGAPSDTSGTVVGAQTSTRDSKDVLGAGMAPDEALALVLVTPVHRFAYKQGSYNGTVFHGIIAEDSPDFAMDPSLDHPAGRSFNPVSSVGILIQAMKALEARVAHCETVAKDW